MRVLIVDDHRIVASGCRALFAEDPDIEILEAFDAESGERAFEQQHPDISVLDINLPTVSGYELARRILGRDAAARIIMFSMNDDAVFAARPGPVRPFFEGHGLGPGDPLDCGYFPRVWPRTGGQHPSRSARFTDPALRISI